MEEKLDATVHRAVTKGISLDPDTVSSGWDWIGEVPRHWKLLPLKRLFDSMEYGTSESLEPEGRVPVLRMGNISGGAVQLDDLKFLDTIDPFLILKEGDLLFNRTNSLDQVGKVGLFSGSNEYPEVSFASYLVRLRPKQDVDPQFLAFLLNTPGILGLARATSLPAIGQANLSPTRYGQLVIPVPPPEEQVAIAEHLMRVVAETSRLASEAENSIALLQEHRSALIAAAVTGKVDVREVASV